MRPTTTPLPSWIMKYSDGRSFKSARCSCSVTDGLPFLTLPRPTRSAAGWKMRFMVSRKPVAGGSVVAPAVVTPYAASRASKSSEPPADRRIWLSPTKSRNTPANTMSARIAPIGI